MSPPVPSSLLPQGIWKSLSFFIIGLGCHISIYHLCLLVRRTRMAKVAESRESTGDRISNLPDGIKCHIISLLDTKDAVSTTVLSTKWKNLWTTAIDDIVLDDSLFNCRTVTGGKLDTYTIKCACVNIDSRRAREGGELESNALKFARFVNTVLRFHDVPVTRRFSLHCLKDGRSYDVYSWVKKAIGKKIEELDLYVECYVNDPIRVPSSIFTCETLRVLKLQGPIFVHLHNTCSLPRLQELTLTLIHYRNDESAQYILSSCPSLESLNISREMLDGVRIFNINSSTLKDLRLDRTFCDGSGETRTVINAPGLKHLELCKGPPIGLIMDNLSSLVSADVSILSNDLRMESYVNNVSNLLQGISHSQILNVSGDTFLLTIPVNRFPTFERLSELQVEIKCCDWNPLQEFMRNSDRLEVLLFRKVSCKKKEHVVSWTWTNPETVPFCLLSSLKRMTFFGFDGEKDELAMVKYILKNAKVLQEMEIHFGPSSQKTATWLRKELLEFSLGSEKCQVTIT